MAGRERKRKQSVITASFKFHEADLGILMLLTGRICVLFVFLLRGRNNLLLRDSGVLHKTVAEENM